MPSSQPARSIGQIDPRGPRFGAAVTSVVLAAVLVLGPGSGLSLLVLQALAFAAGAIDPRYQPYSWFFRRFVRPRLAPPAELEDPRPPRFAQLVGLIFALVALAGAIAGGPLVFFVAAGMALVAALLNALFEFCLGCELYLVGRRLLPVGTGSARAGS